MQSAAAAEKNEIRRRALAARAAIGKDEHQAASWRAVDRLRPLVREGDVVALFWPMRGEIDPLGLIATVRARHGEIAMPDITGGAMVFRRFDGVTMVPGPHGTRNPPASEPECEPALIVAPLAAFDRAGGRIGYGGGHYDRAVERLRGRGHPVRVVGMAFACQEADRIPVEDHDATLDAIVTEKELIRVKDGL